MAQINEGCSIRSSCFLCSADYSILMQFNNLLAIIDTIICQIPTAPTLFPRQPADGLASVPPSLAAYCQLIDLTSD